MAGPGDFRSAADWGPDAVAADRQRQRPRFGAIKSSSPVAGDVCFRAAVKLVSTADMTAQSGLSRQHRQTAALGQIAV
jgi:hypothetical protein